MRTSFFISKHLQSGGALNLSTAGIAAGVATLIVVMAVMNGFQLSFKDAIMELTSSHIRVSTTDESAFLTWCKGQKEIRASYPFREEKSFIIGERGREGAAVIRAVPRDIIVKDEGFAREIGIVSGTFFNEKGGEGEEGAGYEDEKDEIVLGSSLAYTLGVRRGSTVTLLALSGGGDAALLSSERVFQVVGTFHSGYSAINESCAFIPLKTADKYFGDDGGVKTIAIKLLHPFQDARMIEVIKGLNIGVKCQSWREYNSAFFGVLRVEKNMMMAIVAFIFVAVSVNIYNAMRREVYTRREMIALLAATGGKTAEIREVFIVKGFILGITGSAAGTALGVLLSINMKTIFMLPAIITHNPMYMLYASIPARMQLFETIFIAFFALLSPLAASWLASTAVLHLPPQETLRYE